MAAGGGVKLRRSLLPAVPRHAVATTLLAALHAQLTTQCVLFSLSLSLLHTCTTAAGVAVSSDGINWLRRDGLVEGHRSAAEQSKDVGVVLGPNSDNWWTLDTAHLSVSDVQVCVCVRRAVVVVSVTQRENTSNQAGLLCLCVWRLVGQSCQRPTIP